MNSQKSANQAVGSESALFRSARFVHRRPGLILCQGGLAGPLISPTFLGSPEHRTTSPLSLPRASAP